MKQILTLYPNPYDNDTMAKLVIDGLEHTKNVNVVEHDYSKAIYTKEELIEISKEVDYIFVFWTKRTYRFVNETYTYELLDAINRPDIVVYIDGSEYTSTGYHAPNQNWESLKKDPLVNRGEPWINEEMYKRCNWYFKREVYDIDLDRKKIVPLLVGALSSYDHNKQTLTSKQYDMFSSFGQVWTGLRSETEQLCSMLKNEGFNNIIGRNFPLEQYMNYIINSYIGISAWGAGNSCRRMWEIMSNKTCCFVQKKQILFPNKFTDGVNYVEYSSPEEFEHKARYYLKNKEKCIDIGIKGYEHIKNYHTGQKRVEYMFNILEGANWKLALK